MKRILKIGMDVHTTNYTLCAMEPIIGEDDRVFATIKVTPDYKNILMFIGKYVIIRICQQLYFSDTLFS